MIISAFVFLLADKETLELGKVFSTLALLGYIFNFSILYSNFAIESLYALSVFIKRIDQVITEPLLHKDKTFLNRAPLPDVGEEYVDAVIVFDNVSASWQATDCAKNELFTGEEADFDDEVSVLSQVNFNLHRGEKVGVIGTVGSGKSSLLMAILGELPIYAGTVMSR